MPVPSGTPTVDNLPQGFDRADGLNGRLGQATTGMSVQSNGYASSYTDIVPINELPDSPVIERAEQQTVRHSYTGSQSEMLNRIGIYYRGALVTDSNGYYYRVLSATYNQLKGNAARLDIVSESLSMDVPPDEFTITPVRMGIDIMKHPRYFYALMPTNQIPTPWPSTLVADADAQITAKQAIIRAIQAYRENPYISTATAINNITGSLQDNITAAFSVGKLVYSVPNPNFKSDFNATAPDEVGTLYSGLPYPPVPVNNGDPNPAYYFLSIDIVSNDPNGKVTLALAAAQELIGKLWRMEDTPMVNGIELTWSEYFWRPPYLDLGGYIQDPITNSKNPLPSYFYSPTQPPNSSYTIFDYLCQYNPQCFSSDGTGSMGTTNISWLRDADTIDYQRTWFKVTHKWLGAPIGAWDGDLYNGNIQRPSLPTDYHPLIFA